ncbi:TonB family protein [Parvularcula sp. ZS-1/3]|uniref:TonB family protein n=1 Tax=Parvularcula mediterranea TaxID=2732508 RepID=A0A7Y3W3Q9_9PROT|nr:helix-turn-helix domain-containing protein [Parvularcula mediterranea]NNU15005.1 TonB family protein [Parvularcula mediterranea]
MGKADMQSVADVVALDTERQKRAQDADGALSTAGGMLRAAREAMNLSSSELARRTNIKEEHILAIEEMDTSRLPSQPYTMGFVRAYAREVELPEDALLDRFRQQVGWAKRDTAPKVQKVSRAGNADGGREISVLAVLAIIAFILFCAWKLIFSAAPETADDASRYRFSTNDRAEAVSAPPIQPPVEVEARPEARTAQEANGTDGDEVAGAQEENAAAAETEASTAEPEQSEAETAAAEPAVVDEPAEPVIALRRLIATEPVYPPLCEGSAAETETVTVAFTVTTRGNTAAPQVTGSSNPCFNGAALAALSRWRFDPSTVTRENARQTTRFSFERPY